MPLKDVDLKTIEAYKKAVRADVTKINANSPTKFWIYKDIELPDVQGKKQKIPAFVTLIDDRAVRNVLKGKKLICMGACYLESNKVSFEPSKGKVPYRHLKASLPLYFGKPVFIPSNANEDDEADGEFEQEEEEQHPKTSQGVPTAPQPQATPDLSMAWLKLQGEMREAITANPARKDPLVQASQGMGELIKAGNADAVRQKMDAIHKLLAGPPPTSTTPQAPKPDATAISNAWGKLVPKIKESGDQALMQMASDAAKRLGELVKQGNIGEAQSIIDRLSQRLAALHPSSDGKPPAKDVMAAWQKLVPEMEKKAKADPALQQAVMRARKQVEELVKGGKTDEALKTIHELADLLAKPTAPTTGKSEEHEEQEKHEEQEDTRNPAFEKRFAELEERANELLKLRVGDVSQIRTVLGLASEKGGDGDFAGAAKLLDRLEALLDNAAESTEEEGAPYKGVVKYRAALVGFAVAKTSVNSALDKFVNVAYDVVPDDAEVAEEVAEMLRDLNDDLAGLIDGAMNMSEDEESPVKEDFKKALEQYISQVETDELIKRVDANPIHPASIAKTLGGALRRIQSSLPVPA